MRFETRISQDNIEVQRALLTSKHLKGQEYQVSLHRKGARAIIELLPEQRSAEDRFRMLEQARGFLVVPLDINRLEVFFSRGRRTHARIERL